MTIVPAGQWRRLSLQTAYRGCRGRSHICPPLTEDCVGSSYAACVCRGYGMLRMCLYMAPERQCGILLFSSSPDCLRRDSLEVNYVSVDAITWPVAWRLLDTVTPHTCNNENGENVSHLERQVAFVLCQLRGPLSGYMLVLPAYRHSSARKILYLHMAGQISLDALIAFLKFKWIQTWLEI